MTQPQSIESLEVRKVKNGYVIAIRSEEGEDEFVFDTERKAFKFIRDTFTKFA